MANKELDKNCGAYKKKWEVVKTYTDENGDTHTVKQELKSYDDGETWYPTDKETDTITERKDNTPIYSAITEEMCDGPDWCSFTQKIVSRDGGATWYNVGSPSKTILKRNSVEHGCYVKPTPMERYRESSYTFCDDDCNYYSVKVDQKSVDGGITWENVSDPETTLIESNSEHCGCFPPEPEPSTSSVTVTSCTDDYTYTETLVVYEKEDEVWVEKSREVIYTQPNSPRCGYELKYRWLKYDKECINHKLYEKEKHQISYNGGTTWEDIMPLETRLGNTPIGTCDCDCIFKLKTNVGATVRFVSREKGWETSKSPNDEGIVTLDCEDGYPDGITFVEAIPSFGNYSFSPSSVTINCNESDVELIGIPPKIIEKCLSLDLKMDERVVDIFLQSFICKLSLVKISDPDYAIPITGITATTTNGTQVVDEVVVSHHLCGSMEGEKDWRTSDTVSRMCFKIELDNDDDISNYDFVVTFAKENGYNFLKCKAEEVIPGTHEVIIKDWCEEDINKLPIVDRTCCSLTLNGIFVIPGFDGSIFVFNLGNASEVLNFETEVENMECIIYAHKPIPTASSNNLLENSYATTDDIVDTWQAIVGESEARIDEQDRLWNAINELSGSTESPNNTENNER